jgi:hypothetical protein
MNRRAFFAAPFVFSAIAARPAPPRRTGSDATLNRGMLTKSEARALIEVRDDGGELVRFFDDTGTLAALSWGPGARAD